MTAGNGLCGCARCLEDPDWDGLLSRPPPRQTNAGRLLAEVRATVAAVDRWPDVQRRLGAAVRDTREFRRVSLRDLADLVGIHFVHLSRIERGLEGCSPDLAERLCMWIEGEWM